MFFALLDRKREERKEHNWRAGVIAATIANAMADNKAQPWDFFPELKSEQEMMRGEDIAKTFMQAGKEGRKK